MRELRHGEAAQVAHHHQDVFIHRVDMEQIVLHLPDDASERGDIGAEDAVLIHPAQGMQNAFRLAQYLHETRPVQRIPAECSVDLVLCAPQRAQRLCGEIGQFGVLLHQQEQFKDRPRRLLEQILVADIQQCADDPEPLVQRVLRRHFMEQVVVQVLQQDGVELAHRNFGAVVTLHQVFAGTPVGRSGDAHLLGERGLELEDQAVFAAHGEIMQTDAQCLQQRVMPGDLACLGRADQACLGKLGPARAQARCAADPGDGLQVAQAAGAFLEIGFEVEISFHEARMPLLLFMQFGKEELARVEMLLHCFLQSTEQLGIAGEQARFEQVGLHGDVGRFVDALRHGADTVADFHADVPQHADQLLQFLLQGYHQVPNPAGSAGQCPTWDTTHRARNRRPRPKRYREAKRAAARCESDNGRPAGSAR